METEYSVEVCKNLEKQFSQCNLYRPFSREKYDEGDELEYSVTAVTDGQKLARIRVVILKSVGGGFAGQVYQIKLVNIEGSTIPELSINGIYAMKILIPPSKGSVFFRNLMYGIGFQGPFQLQVNPSAARSGALWQQFIHRGAQIRFQSDKIVNRIHATFIDENLGSCGEISDWVDGRTWRLEVDENLDTLKKWEKGKTVDAEKLRSPEYRTKKTFMQDFVKLLHDMGAHEFARQYEWTTWKSQPNCLKRSDTEDNPETGLVAVDFRAGLTLLPFLPMSPGDVKLIFQGIGRGSLVQFDRGNIKKLESFIHTHKAQFQGMESMLEELKQCELVYRNSVPDIAHNHFKLLYSTKLWSTMLQSTITAWKIRNTIDQKTSLKFVNNYFLVFLFKILGLLPFIGGFFRKLWGHHGWRRHYGAMMSNFGYLKRAIKGKIIEITLPWYRAGRIEKTLAMHFPNAPGLFLLHLPLSILPAKLHKFLTNWDYFKERLDYILARPVRLYFVNEEREKWMREMVDEGKDKYIIDNKEAALILSQIKEPFIQKYLKCLAVHVCTVPITQVVSVLIAGIFILQHPEFTWKQAVAAAVTIIAAFQIVPISPGSLTRGLYVLYLVIRERNFKDYNIAIFLGFFKYIGYLAFPIQMAYRYPILARFMAGHWATEAVHTVPVFGENGALLEHKVFSLFYNWPLTIRRKFNDRTKRRAMLKPRFWHVGIYAILGSALLILTDNLYLHFHGSIPSLKEIWWLILLLPLLGGAGVTIGCGGARLNKRIIAAIVFAIWTAAGYAIVTVIMSGYVGDFNMIETISGFVWRTFLFSIFATIGILSAELVMK